MMAWYSVDHSIRPSAVRLRPIRLDDRAVHIAVGLRLGANICEPHQCPYGATVDAKRLHGLSCKGGSGRSVRHHALNDLIWRALSKADIPATKEPPGLLRTDGKRPDGVTLLPWKNGRCATWDVTVTDTMAQHISYGWCCSGNRGTQENSQIRSTSADLCFCSNCRGNHGNHRQRRTWIPWRPGKVHYTSHRWYPRVCLPVPAPVSSYLALQCGRHPGHLCPHNLWGRILGRSSLFVFNFCF